MNAISRLKLIVFEVVSALFESLLNKAKHCFTCGRHNISSETPNGILENIKARLTAMPKLDLLWRMKSRSKEVETALKEKNEALLLASCQRLSSNVLVLDHIFEYLSFKDLKNVRLVCSTWEEVSQHKFENCAKVLITSFRRRPENFLEDFDKCPLNISKYELLSCSTSKLQMIKILRSEINHISSLTLVNIALFDEGEQMREFDLSQLIGENLKSLRIDCSRLKTKMVIRQSNLIGLRYLNLHTCKLILASGSTKFTPDEIYLHNISFCKINGQQIFVYPLLWPFYIIEYDWLSVLQITTFTQTFLYSVINWDDLLAPSMSLTLTNFDFTQAPWVKNIVLSKLTITGVTTGFDWALVPEKIETLILDDVYPALPNPPVGFLPNLKEFHFICKYWNSPPYNSNFFSCFSSHTTLRKVKLKCHYFSVSRNNCNLDWIPSSVAELHLHKFNIMWADEVIKRDVDTLILTEYTLSGVFDILKYIKTNTLRCIVSDYPRESICMKILFRIRLCHLLRLSINSIHVAAHENE